MRAAVAAAALSLAMRLRAAGGEAMAPPLKYTVRPVAEAFPAFHRGDPPVFTVTRDFPARSADEIWSLIQDQKRLIGSMKCVVERMNGSLGSEEMIVKWETPVDWHRWHRTDVRKYVTRKEKVNSFFLVGGFGLWLPRLAFREQVAATGGRSSQLQVGVWYEFDEAYIGWDTTNLKNLTVVRWNKFYDQYSEAIRKILNAENPWDDAPHGKGKPKAKAKAKAKPEGKVGPKAEL